MTAILIEPRKAPTATHTGGYIRLTRDESLQTGLSAPAQRKAIQEYAHRAGLAGSGPGRFARGVSDRDSSGRAHRAVGVRAGVAWTDALERTGRAGQHCRF